MQSGCAAGFSLAADVEEDAKAKGRWEPGKNIGSFIQRRWAPVQIQSSVLLVNLILNITKLPKQLLQQMLQHLPTMADGTLSSLTFRVASRLVRVPGGSLRNVLAGAKKRKYFEAESSSDRKSTSAAGPESSRAAQSSTGASMSATVLKTLAREALSNAVSGRSDAEYVRSLVRLRLHGVATGSKYHSRDFVALVEFLAASVVRVLDADSLHTPLTGHGLQSHFGLSFDIGSLGRAMFTKHESLICITLSCVDWQTGQLQSRVFGMPSAGEQHGGDSQVKTVLQALSQHPGGVSIRLLESRLACVGGDGAVCYGGPDARRNSTGAANKLWEVAMGDNFFEQEAVTLWGLFHRSDRAQAGDPFNLRR